MPQERKILYGFSPHESELSVDQLLQRKPVNVGWHALITELCNRLFSLGWHGHLLDCKEKFGQLRFSVNVSHKHPHAQEILNTVLEYENRSVCICEFCGSTPAQVRLNRSWIKTLCAECVQKEMSQSPNTYRYNTPGVNDDQETHS
jgi:hypothetical protein